MTTITELLTVLVISWHLMGIIFMASMWACESDRYWLIQLSYWRYLIVLLGCILVGGYFIFVNDLKKTV